MGGSSVSPPSRTPDLSESLSPDGTSIESQLAAMRQSLVGRVPYTSGVHTVKPQDLVLYYNSEAQSHASRIDFGNATERDLSALAAACHPTNIQAGSYHRVLELDATQFAARLDGAISEILEVIGPDILQFCNADGGTFLRAEAQKLHLFGPGSFIKRRQSTSNSKMMIGSLVLCFTTAHAGGAFTVELESKTWSFESPAAPNPPTSISFLAVYGDAVCSMDPIHTGNLCTLSYSLFLADRTSAANLDQTTVPTAQQTLTAALQALLANPGFLPSGGFLASGLAHKYPIPLDPERCGGLGQKRPVAAQWNPLLRLLKGTDARVRAAAECVGLVPRIKLLYDTWGEDVITDDILDLDGVYENFFCKDEETFPDMLMREGVKLQRGQDRVGDCIQAYKAQEIRGSIAAFEALAALTEEERRNRWYRFDQMGIDANGTAEEAGRAIRVYHENLASHWTTRVCTTSKGVPVRWLTPLTSLNRVKSTYTGEDTLHQSPYGDAGLFMQVPAVGEGIRASVA
ncbi:hypothetical protein DFH07DRAFT_943964 [Mycena maculata]|uniref:Uncharacterized protein n=1 Tax=Mycena maculata TaxID=230809 RepID=A0AAD7MZI2_9AGAR|nr:hypothetical protein DFH07DRAFT_943964 [Mycena maculata]